MVNEMGKISRKNGKNQLKILTYQNNQMIILRKKKTKI
jgi:hypothetical protein